MLSIFKKEEKWVVPLLLYAGFVSLLLFFGNGIYVPIIHGDEAGYVGNARFLTLDYKVPKYNNPYHPGYSLLIAPVFWFTSDTTAAYRAIIVLNAFILSLNILAIYFLLKKIWPDIKTHILLTITLVTCLYPTSALSSNLAMSEAGFIPFYGLTCLSAACAFDKRYWFYWVILGILAGFLYVIHPKAIAVICALVIVSIWVLWPLLKNIHLHISFFSGLVIIIISGKYIEKYISEHGHWSAQISTTSTSAYSAKAFVSSQISTIDFSRLLVLIYEIAGQGFYLIVSTYGLFVVSLIVAFIYFKKVFINGDKSLIAQISAFIGLSMVATWMLSSLKMYNGSRADHFIYGRYNEGVLSPFILLSLIGLLHPLWREIISARKWVVIVCGSFLVFGGLLFFGRTPEELSRSLNPANVLGIFPVYRVFQELSIIKIGLFSLALSLPFVYLTRRYNKSIVVWGLIGVFLVSSYYTGKVYFTWGARSRAKQKVVADAVNKISDNLNVDFPCINYDRTTFQFWHYFNYQFFLPRSEFRYFEPRKKPPLCSELIISGRYDINKYYPYARLITFENHFKQALWVTPGNVQKRLINKGLVFPEKFPGPLEPEAYRSEIRIHNYSKDSLITLRKGESRNLTATVQHQGLGSPWPNRYGLGEEHSSVSLGIIWYQKISQESKERRSINNISLYKKRLKRLRQREQAPSRLAEYRSELPYTLFPGESVVLRIVLKPFGYDKKPLPSGEYKVVLSMVQEGVTWFYQKNDRPVTLKVRIVD
jgi:hypothetical protein